MTSNLGKCSYTGTGINASGFTASGTGNIDDTVNLPSSSSIIYRITADISPMASGTLSNTAVIIPPNVTLTSNSITSATDEDAL